MDIDLVISVLNRVRDQVIDEELDGGEAMDLAINEIQDEYEFLNDEDIDV